MKFFSYKSMQTIPIELTKKKVALITHLNMDKVWLQTALTKVYMDYLISCYIMGCSKLVTNWFVAKLCLLNI